MMNTLIAPVPLWNHNVIVEAMKQIGVVEQNQVVQRASVRDDDHRPGRTPSSRCARKSSSRSASVSWSGAFYSLSTACAWKRVSSWRRRRTCVSVNAPVR